MLKAATSSNTNTNTHYSKFIIRIIRIIRIFVATLSFNVKDDLHRGATDYVVVPLSFCECHTSLHFLDVYNWLGRPVYFGDSRGSMWELVETI